ncbi:hypothetical protein VFPFJ_02086 [Purpureocillium lilacinum]|uniref:Uncharacterized protein n=1 Tax=Purpureocillium lilacinum TaxID=33203 RepID=A0A179HR34_PURLI|nr:hypothetical protein VFPFJ_02086 [Purpureocillium lilacinum]OAQ71853.1 hypothetical protein VFPBJ_10632 [Purpureocillium lilacinum]OAQ92925.1 hypothetical protein VFPFJ_02086 [Purpureocillium lilacinum]
MAFRELSNEATVLRQSFIDQWRAVSTYMACQLTLRQRNVLSPVQPARLPHRPAQTAVHLPPIARHHGRSSTIVVSTMGPLIQNCHPCRSSTRPCALCAPRLPRRHASLRTNALPPLPTRWAPISRLLLSVTHLYLDRRLLCRFDFPLLVSMRMLTLL